MPIHLNDYFTSFTSFVLLGVLVGLLSTVGPAPAVQGRVIPNNGDRAEGGTQSPPDVNDDISGSNTLAVVQSLAPRISVLVGQNLSPTSTDELSARITSTFATPASARTFLLSAFRERGWIGLNDITGDAGSFLGAFQGMNVPYDENIYLCRLTCYVVLDVICREFDLLNGPALLNDIASDIALRLARLDPSTLDTLQLPPSASTLLPGDTTTIDRVVHLVLIPIATTVIPLVLALMHQIGNPRVWHAFRLFARNPTSLTEYLRCTPGMPSVKQIVDATAASIASPSPQPSFRTLTLAPRIPGRNAGQGLSLIKELIRMAQGGGTGGAGSLDTVDPEAGLVLDGDELRYASALIVVVLTPGLSN